MEARKGEGVKELMTALDMHRTYIRDDALGKAIQKEKLKKLILSLFKEDAWNSLIKGLQGKEEFEGIIGKAQEGTIDPYEAVRMILQLALSKNSKVSA